MYVLNNNVKDPFYRGLVATGDALLRIRGFTIAEDYVAEDPRAEDPIAEDSMAEDCY